MHDTVRATGREYCYDRYLLVHNIAEDDDDDDDNENGDSKYDDEMTLPM